ncbi:hypothetical protein LZ32DRAFT_603762 [Colletotrichum eremochloae]|nr:hypothetical protein LZ32DRAFT_603762 [Colletotrichum eremochloae]
MAWPSFFGWVAFGLPAPKSFVASVGRPIATVLATSPTSDLIGMPPGNFHWIEGDNTDERGVKHVSMHAWWGRTAIRLAREIDSKARAAQAGNAESGSAR